MNKRIINLYAERNFSKKFSDTSDFFMGNWKTILRILSYFIVPLSLVESVNMAEYMNSVYSMNSGYNQSYVTSLMLNFALLMLLGIVSGIVTSGVAYAIMKAYRERNGNLAGLTMSEMKPLLVASVKKSAAVVCLCSVAGVLLFVLDCLLVVVHPLLFFVATVALIVCMVPLALVIPAYQFEDIRIFAAIRKSFYYGFKTWGGIVALAVVMSILVNMICGVFSVPMYILMMIKAFAETDMSSSLSGVTGSVWYAALTYLFTALCMYVNQVGASILFVALAYQYGHAATKFGGKGIDEQVERFEKLGDADETETASDRADTVSGRADITDDIDKAFEGV